MADMQHVFLMKCMTVAKVHVSAHTTFRGACDEAARLMMATDWEQCRVPVRRALETEDPKDVVVRDLLSVHRLEVRP